MIVVRCKGGLGNQFFQYAAGRALAARHGVPLKIDAGWYEVTGNQVKVARSFDLGHFQITGELATASDLRRFGLGAKHRIGRLVGRWRRAWSGRRYWNFDGQGYPVEFETLGRDAVLDGYFQHPRFFLGIADQLRNEFRLREPPPSVVQEHAARLRAGHSVGVQVRRTDYLSPESLSTHGVCNVDYYRRAWSEVKAKVPQARTTIFTDDVRWARDHLGDLAPDQIVGEELAGPGFVHKFFLLASCRHFISANSSFGWWAAWLGAKEDSVVVLPRQWFRSSNVDQMGLRLPGWLAC